MQCYEHLLQYLCKQPGYTTAYGFKDPQQIRRHTYIRTYYLCITNMLLQEVQLLTCRTHHILRTCQVLYKCKHCIMTSFHAASKYVQLHTRTHAHMHAHTPVLHKYKVYFHTLRIYTPIYVVYMPLRNM